MLLEGVDEYDSCVSSLNQDHNVVGVEFSCEGSYVDQLDGNRVLGIF